MLEQGPSKRANLMEWEKIWAINKRIIDPICPRYSAVSVEKASKIIVTNVPKEPEVMTVANNKLNPALGERPQWKSNELLIEFDDADQLVVVG
jgi:glutamyl-tRNA synthetase